MTSTVLKQELHAAIETMPERNLAALRPLFTVLAEPLYIRETDLTPEELAIIEAGDKEYREHPETFTPLSALL
ncbi:hypothetical protein FACS189483_02720 [Spirochaetia bacterium]|nr:hypothetical protein FACS189483_02720 [Spirochaetia bacterium]